VGNGKCDNTPDGGVFISIPVAVSP